MNGDGSPAIQVFDLRRVFTTKTSIEVPALRGVNLSIEPGSYVALKGRSGSGKTTLLNCLGGLDAPTSGKILVFGQEITAMSQDQLTTWRRHQVGFVFQSFGLLTEPVCLRKCRAGHAPDGEEPERAA